MFKKIASTFLTKILTAFINLIVAVVISRWTGAEGKGIQGLFIATLTMITTVMGILGLISLTYLVPKKKTANYFVIADLWSILIGIIVYFLLKSANVVPQNFVLQLSIISFLASVAGNHLSIYLIKEKISTYNFLLFGQPLVNILIIIIMFAHKGSFSINDYVNSLTISFLLQFLYSFAGLKILIKEKFTLKIKEFAEDMFLMFRYGFINQLGTLVQMISFRGTYYILDAFSSTIEVGIYSNAVSIAESVWIISRSLALVFYSRVINTGSKAYHLKLYRRFASLAFWLQVIALCCLILIPANIYVIIFGEEFKDLKYIILLLLPAMLFFGQSLITGHYFSGTGKHHINLLSNFTGMLMVLIISFILIPQYVTTGAAIATALGYFSLLIVHSIFLKKFIGIHVWQQIINLRLILRWTQKNLKNKNMFFKISR